MQSALDRRQAILELLSDRRQTTLDSLALEFGVSDSVLFIVCDNLPLVVMLILRCCIHNELYFILDLDEEIVSIWLFLDEFNSVANQLHQIVII